MKASRATLRTVLAGVIVALIAASATVVGPVPLDQTREVAIGALSRLGPASNAENVAVVDIDRRSADALGTWPWARSELARVIRAIAAERPAAIAIDMVFSGACDDNAENRALADALRQAPVSLGFVVAENGEPLPVLSPIAIRRPIDIPGLWLSAGSEQPCPMFIAAARGLASISLAGDKAATVRSVPALVAVGQDLYPGLAIDGARLADGAGTLIVGGVDPARLSLGGLQARLDKSGNLRLRSSGPTNWRQRTVSAVDVLDSGWPPLAGKLVFLGSSLPQSGGLRPTDASPVAPSVQIEADAASAFLTRSLPWRPAIAPLLEAAVMLIAAAGTVWVSLKLRPFASAGIVALAAVLWGAFAVVIYRLADLVFDPLLPALGMLATGVAVELSQYAAAREAEDHIRRSFEQRLPPAVVARLVAAGDDLKLEGEERVITVLTTDIEGFTAMTAAAGPRELIRLLDGYFEGLTHIIIEAGGMVDKIVGDAVHAIFNVPLPIGDHAATALACAEKISAFSDVYRSRDDARRYGFGRTRIGIETGPAVVGDVGSFGKIDYTAYGDVVNMAARLQEANKLTGTSILAGVGVKSAQPAGWQLESRGTLDLRGLGQVEVFVPKRLA